MPAGPRGHVGAQRERDASRQQFRRIHRVSLAVFEAPSKFENMPREGHAAHCNPHRVPRRPRKCDSRLRSPFESPRGGAGAANPRTQVK